jgi:mannose/fructose/N-acetylgalactosamine-specific phosphotransferase system component IIC
MYRSLGSLLNMSVLGIAEMGGNSPVHPIICSAARNTMFILSYEVANNPVAAILRAISRIASESIRIVPAC